jgi:hypothetical protein
MFELHTKHIRAEMRATAKNGLPGVCMDPAAYYGKNPLSRTVQLRRLTDRRIRHYERAGLYGERRAIVERREGRLVWSG